MNVPKVHACETHFKGSQFISMNLFHHFQFTNENISPPQISQLPNLKGRVLGRLSQCLPAGIHGETVPAAQGANGSSASKSFTAMDASFPASERPPTQWGGFPEDDPWIFLAIQTETGLDLCKFYSIKGWLVLSRPVVELGKTLQHSKLPALTKNHPLVIETQRLCHKGMPATCTWSTKD